MTLPQDSLGIEAVPHKSDRRRSERIRTLSRIVRVNDGSRAGFGECRDLSDHGMRQALPVSVPPRHNLEVAFSSEFSVQAEVVWANGHECGIAFHEPVNCMALLSSTYGSLATGDDRQTTFPSTQWEPVAARAKFTPGLRVKLSLENGIEKPAKIRWTMDRLAALVLLHPFTTEESDLK